MTDEELLAMLRALDDDPVDPRFDRLAEGVATAKEQAELQAQAAEDPEQAQLLALFAPLPSALDAQIAERVIEARAPTHILPSPAQLEPPPRRRAWGALAAAAIVLLGVWALWPSASSKPENTWSLKAMSGEKLYRDEAAPRPIYGPGSTVKLVVQPKTAPKQPIEIAAWWVANGQARRLDDTVLTASANGVAVFKSAIEALEPAVQGPQQLVFLIGVPDTLPVSRHMPAARLLESSRWHAVAYAFERRLSP